MSRTFLNKFNSTCRSLDGRVDTLNAKLGVTSTVTDKLRLAANYVYDDRDNDTPQLPYDRVVTDVFLSGSRTNLPYSFTRSELKLSADYRFDRRIKFVLGLDDDTHERTFQEVEETVVVEGRGRIPALDHQEVVVLEVPPGVGPGEKHRPTRAIGEPPRIGGERAERSRCPVLGYERGRTERPEAQK